MFEIYGSQQHGDDIPTVSELLDLYPFFGSGRACRLLFSNNGSPNNRNDFTYVFFPVAKCLSVKGCKSVRV